MSRNRTLFLAAAGVLALVLSASGQDSPDDEKKLVQQAQELAKENKLDEAAAVMKKAIRLAPKNDLYLAVTSQFEFKAGKYADGAEHALQAVKLNDKVGFYHLLVAANSMGDQELDRAREY